MKIYGYKSDDQSEAVIVPSELAEITLVASSEELRKIASFLVSAANGMDARGRKWEHEHLSDKYKEFESSPHFVVFNPEVGQ